MAVLNPATEFDYSARVRELFADLQHAGTLPATPARLVAIAGSREQGAQVCLQAEIVAGRVQLLRYQAYGCPHLLAACETLARWLEGRTVQDAGKWSRHAVELELALPAQKRARLLILEDALQRLLAQVAHSVPGV